MAKSLDLQVILAARDKITGPLKKINATSTGTARALKQSQQEIKQLKASQRDVSSFRKMDRAIQENSQSLNAAQEKVRQLGQEHISEIPFSLPRALLVGRPDGPQKGVLGSGEGLPELPAPAPHVHRSTGQADAAVDPSQALRQLGWA